MITLNFHQGRAPVVKRGRGDTNDTNSRPRIPLVRVNHCSSCKLIHSGNPDVVSPPRVDSPPTKQSDVNRIYSDCKIVACIRLARKLTLANLFRSSSINTCGLAERPAVSEWQSAGLSTILMEISLQARRLSFVLPDDTVQRFSIEIYRRSDSVNNFTKNEICSEWR